MSPEVELLSRAHEMFAGAGRPPVVDGDTERFRQSPHAVSNLVAAQGNYHRSAQRSHAALLSAARTDAAASAILSAAHHDHETARDRTGRVVQEARADASVTPTTPLGQREAMRRRAARLRSQRAHVLLARRRARRHLAALRALRYRGTRHHRRASASSLSALRLPTANGRAGIAVRAALSRLGRPYVWGATGPNQFDCSGLVQWSYAQAGVHLDRTTYQQINDGIPVPRSQVRPGDLVFPHAGHVQLAIGNNMVVEAPYSGANVRISPLGGNVQIRRPL
ncbi:NlpC/P60 family protein [Mycobacterium kubicae]|uniref:C40 family peptidase n=1 Tax=Mycobacterium kubicae TaxID=120959 RepID=UPI001641FD5A|nr:C40 family peptidase [Mycobacterium kubicae]QNI04906.1 NlpC/P60 family protein [Mycobacterium kubicae]